MAKLAKELSALEISRLKHAGNHAVGGVAGLYLYVKDSGSRAWVLRVVIGDKRRHIGLGSYPEVPLAHARQRAREAKEQITQGLDPIAERAKAKAQLRAEQASDISFSEAATAYIAAHGDTWKNTKHRAQWASTIETYANPLMGKLSVRLITQTHILEVLEPIWREKNETASRLRGRIESVLDWATVRGYRSGENPAQWRGRLDKLLPAPSKIQKVQHQRALPFNDLPDFVERLHQAPGVAAHALMFLILTAARSGEVRGACWSEIDLDARIWIVPAERMKAGREHRVPLSEEAIALLQMRASASSGTTDLVFPSPKLTQLSDMSLTAVMRRMKVDAVPHGFRSSFRDWVGEATHHPGELAEQALAHVNGDKVEAAYRRGDALGKRLVMMQEWAQYIYGQMRAQAPRRPARHGAVRWT